MAARRRRREVVTSGLSFLDCISCGFGAAVLLFMLVDHARIDRDASTNHELIARLDVIEDQVLDGKQELLAQRAALSRDVEAKQTAERDAQRLREKIEALRASMPEGDDAATRRDAKLQELQQDLLALETRVAAMRAAAQDASANATRTVIGEGERQYLTGLRVDGRHALILVDSSASMLGETIVEAIRRRNMNDAAKLAAPKWKRTVATVDWITARLAPDAQFQLVAFGEKAAPVLGGGSGWIANEGGRGADRAMAAFRKRVPAGGTSLVSAFEFVRTMSPRPDSVYLITDGLPTQGAKPRGGVVSGRDRLRYFEEAVQRLPGKVPVHVVLLPIEGDPRAAASFWQLARVSGGGFLEPAADWP